MTFRIKVGCDPGAQGAIAILCDGQFHKFHDMPMMARTTKGNEVNAAALAEILRETRRLFPGADMQAIIEQVNAMPPRSKPGEAARFAGSASSFNFGESFGKLKACFEVLGIPYTLVHPASWKKRYGLTGKDKDVARTLAIQRFPAAASHLTRKKDIGRADSILLAAYADAEQVVSDPVPKTTILEAA